MATIRRIVQTNPVSDFSRYQPRTSGAFDVLASVAETAFEVADPIARQDAQQMGKQAGYEAARGVRGPNLTVPAEGWGAIRAGIFAGESGGDMNALFGYSNRPGGRFEGVRVTDMTVDEALTFSDPSGEYGQWVASQNNGTVATPMGGFQVVGSTLRAAKEGLGLTGSEKLTPEMQDQIGQWIFKTQGTAAWVGYQPVVASMPAVAVTDPTTGELRGIPEATFSGPYQRVYDAAAGVAYQAQVLDQAATDLQAIALQFPYDPQGYQAAADAYVRDIVQQAPQDMRPDIEAQLASDARRRVLGLQADKLRDIETRANNASKALSDRYTTAYAEAKAAGDEEAAAEALTQLDSILRARESLPGSGWTPEQSANQILAAERGANDLIEGNRSRISTEMKDNLDLAIDAATSGRMSNFDALANDPVAATMFPDLVRELQAYQAINSALPDFARMSMAQRNRAVENMLAQPVSEDWQIGYGEALQTKNERINEAWSERTIETAQEYMATKPPALVDMTTESPEDAIVAMRRRRDYVNAVVGQKGLTESPLFLSADEAESLKAVLDVGVEPGIRAAVATGIIRGFGADAERVFKQLGIDDPVLKMGAMLSSRGVDATVLTQALQGQALIQEKAVQLPKQADIMSSEEAARITKALQQIPGGTQRISEVMSFANALYASQAVGIDPSSGDATTLMETSMQRALGLQKWDGYSTGGIQPVYGSDALLPANVAPQELELAISRAFGVSESAPASPTGPREGMLDARAPAAAMPQAWEAAGGIPYVGSTPLSPREFQSEMVRLVPGDRGGYRMEIHMGGAVIPVTTADGRLYRLDVNRLIDATNARMPRIKPR